MADRSPPPRAGYTRTGKSIKAVKRYYAMRNPSRKKKSPDDEKLSKRIAAELKVQQEANKKRNRQSGTFENEVTDRSSALPIIMQTREVGPTFVTSPKSVKSAKSAGTVAQIVENPTNFIHNFSNTSNGCLVACLFLGVIYVVAWLYYHFVSKTWNQFSDTSESSMNSVKWVALTSVGVILTVPLSLALRDRFGYAILSLISMITCASSLLVHLVYYIITDKSRDDKNPSQPKFYLSPRNPLNFWLSITFLLMVLVVISVMIRQLLNIVSKQIDGNNNNTANPQNSRDAENGHGQALSQYMMPA